MGAAKETNGTWKEISTLSDQKICYSFLSVDALPFASEIGGQNAFPTYIISRSNLVSAITFKGFGESAVAYYLILHSDLKLKD